MINPENGNPENGDPENFVTRWSRRKREVLRDAEGTKAPTPQAASEGAAEDKVSGDAPPVRSYAPDSVEPPFDPASLPPIESITAETDIRAFLAPGVPAELSRAALRRVWTSDPKIRNFVGLADYDWDFNAPGSMAGFGPLQIIDELRQVVARIAGPAGSEDGSAELFDRPPAAAESAGESGQTASDAEGALVAQSPNNVMLSQDESLQKIGASRDRDELMGHQEENIASQYQSQNSENLKSTGRRSHGKALPK
jgi:hypothetical protein